MTTTKTDPFRLIRYPQIPRDWDQRFLYLAATIAAWSKDPSTRLGAVAVRDRRVLVTAYNGLPSHVADTPERLNNRDLKYALTIHAEANIINTAARHGVCLAGSTVYVYPLMPCSHCAASLIQAQVSKIVVPNFIEPKRWSDSCDLSRQLFSEAGVGVERLDLEGPLASAALLTPREGQDDDMSISMKYDLS